MTQSNNPSDEDLGRQIVLAAALVDAPAEQVHKAEALFVGTRRADLSEVARAALRLVQAVLRFDSSAQATQALGMRSVGSETRHLLFSAEGRDIDLRVESAGDGFALCGQILGPDESGIVELSRDFGDYVRQVDANHTPDRVAELDPLGEFRIEGIPAGVYRLMLKLGGDQIVLPPIEAGTSAGR